MEWYHWFAEASRNLAWPIVILIVVVLFRKQVVAAINYLTTRLEKLKITPKGVTAEFNSSKDLIPPKAIRGGESDASKGPQVHQYLYEAQKFVDDEKNAEAIVKLKEANFIRPNYYPVLHNLGTLLIREGLSLIENEERSAAQTQFIQAEEVCRSAMFVADFFPFGTLYNLCRAQYLGLNIVGLEETYGRIERLVDTMPRNLKEAIVGGDPQIGGDPLESSSTTYKSMYTAYALNQK